MTKPANQSKPSPADTPTKRPHDEGGKSKVRRSDRVYHADEHPQDNIAKKREQDEQPVNPVKKAPKDNV